MTIRKHGQALLRLGAPNVVHYVRIYVLESTTTKRAVDMAQGKLAILQVLVRSHVIGVLLAPSQVLEATKAY